jgi:hypothetical protein
MMASGDALRYNASHMDDLRREGPGHYVDGRGRGRIVEVEGGWQVVMPWGHRLPAARTLEAAHQELVQAYRAHQRGGAA